MKFSVLPRIGSRIKKPLIGSGKVKRRAIIKPFKTKDLKEKKELKFFYPKRSNLIPNIKPRKPHTSPLKFQNSATKLLFEYWNRLGHPFVKHKPIRSRVTSLGIEKLNKFIKQDGKESILRSIEVADEVFKSGWFRWRIKIGKMKISLPNFLTYNNNDFKRVSGQIKNCPRSWYKECLKGIEYMEANYSTVLKDKHPHITERFTNIWKVFSTTELKLGVRLNNDIIKISALIYKFCKIHKLDWLMVIDVIDKMLNEWRTYKPKHLGYLKNKIFWEEQLPKELIRYGVVDKGTKWISIL